MNVGKLLPIPDISNKKFSEAKALEDKGEHLRLYQFSPTDYAECGKVWNVPHPEDGQERTFQHIPVGYRGKASDLAREPQLNSPLDPAMIADVTKRMK